MALVRKFEEKRRERYSVHKEIDAYYSSFERDGQSLLQIDTYGSKDRQMPGKQSQTLQLDKTGAAALYRILKDTFHFN